MAPHDLPHSVMSRQSNQNPRIAVKLRHVRDLHHLVQQQQLMELQQLERHALPKAGAMIRSVQWNE
jgi:hypothetical protein